MPKKGVSFSALLDARARFRQDQGVFPVFGCSDGRRSIEVTTSPNAERVAMYTQGVGVSKQARMPLINSQRPNVRVLKRSRSGYSHSRRRTRINQPVMNPQPTLFIIWTKMVSGFALKCIPLPSFGSGVLFHRVGELFIPIDDCRSQRREGGASQGAGSFRWRYSFSDASEAIGLELLKTRGSGLRLSCGQKRLSYPVAC